MAERKSSSIDNHGGFCFQRGPTGLGGLHSSSGPHGGSVSLRDKTAAIYNAEVRSTCGVLLLSFGVSIYGLWVRPPPETLFGARRSIVLWFHVLSLLRALPPKPKKRKEKARL